MSQVYNCHLVLARVGDVGHVRRQVILLGNPAEIVVVVESLARLDRVPDGFTLMAFPLDFRGRGGSPIRAVGLAA